MDHAQLRLHHRDADRLLVADADTASINARLVAAGVRVTEITAERRSLEDVVLSGDRLLLLT